MLGGGGSYDVAQVCLNGHMTNDQYLNAPKFNQPFCEKCGAKTIQDCPNCNNGIRGRYESPGVVDFSQTDTPKFCIYCGEAFPWTRAALDAAIQAAKDESALTPEEKEQFAKDVVEITKDSPVARVSAGRVKKVLGKMATETAGFVRDLVVDITSEAIKKSIWPGA